MTDNVEHSWLRYVVLDYNLTQREIKSREQKMDNYKTLNAQVLIDPHHGPCVRIEFGPVVVSVWLIHETATVSHQYGDYGLVVSGPWHDVRTAFLEAVNDQSAVLTKLVISAGDEHADPIGAAIDALSQITARHLDNASVEELAQLFYWGSKYQGSIFVKTIGRLSKDDGD